MGIQLLFVSDRFLLYNFFWEDLIGSVCGWHHIFEPLLPMAVTILQLQYSIAIRNNSFRLVLFKRRWRLYMFDSRWVFLRFWLKTFRKFVAPKKVKNYSNFITNIRKQESLLCWARRNIQIWWTCAVARVNYIKNTQIARFSGDSICGAHVIWFLMAYDYERHPHTIIVARKVWKNSRHKILSH